MSKVTEGAGGAEVTPARQQNLRFLAVSAAGGAALGLLFTVALIVSDIGGLRGFLQRSQEPLLPALMIVIPLALTFGGAATGLALLLLPLMQRRSRRLDHPSPFEALTREIETRRDEDSDHGRPE